MYSCLWIYVPSIPKGSLGDRRETWTVLWKTGRLGKSRSGRSRTSWWGGWIPLPFFDPFPISFSFPSLLLFPFPLPFLFHSLLSLSLSFPPVPLPLPSFPFLPLPTPSFLFHSFSSYSLPFSSPENRLGVWGAFKLPERCSGQAPAVNAFLRYFEAKKRS